MIGTVRPFTMRSKPRRKGSKVPVRVICPSGKMQTISPWSRAYPAQRSALRIMRGPPDEEMGIVPMIVMSRFNNGWVA